MEVKHADELAGFEDCRTTLWSHPFVVALGLTLLPLLSGGDLYCEGEKDLAQLAVEGELLLAKLEPISASTGFGAEFITRRCQNILGAVYRAHEVGGGVFMG